MHASGSGFFICLLWAAIVCSFSLSHNVLLREYAIHSFKKSFLLWMDIWVISSLELLTEDCCGCFCPCLLVDISFHFSWVYTWARNCLVIGYSCLGFVNTASLPTWLYLFHEQCIEVPAATSSKIWYCQSIPGGDEDSNKLFLT